MTRRVDGRVGRRLLVLATALAAVGCSSRGDSAADPGVAAAAATISAAHVRDHIAFLASDALRGRATPSPGLDSAVAYAARRLAALGLRPGIGDSSFVQAYPFPLLRLDPDSVVLRLRGPAGPAVGRHGRDCAVVPGHRGRMRGRVVPLAATVVAPDAPVVPAAYLAGPVASAPWLEARERHVREALRLGAEVIVHVLDPSTAAGLFGDVSQAVAQPARLLGGLSPVVEVFLSRTLLEQAVGQAVSATGLDSALTAATLELELAAPVRELDRAEGRNAVAVYPGADPALAHSYVVISAHIDHLGVGEPVDGDSIYNGADDDASGVAALLEVAEAFAALPSPTRRSIIFLAVSGEERGLLGSRWFLEHAPVPVDSFIADINIDMVGRNSPDSIAAVGLEYSTLGRILREAAEGLPDVGLVVTGDLWPEEQFFFRSDHFQFAVRGIPAVFLFAGTHADYHRPSDEVERIDADKAARAARLAFYAALRVANAAEAPVWTRQGEEALSALRTTPRPSR